MPARHTDIDQFVVRMEKDPRKKAALIRARKRLANTSYKEAKNIAALRLQRGWSQADLSGAMNTSQSHVARIESGDDVRVSTVLNLARALQITPEEMFNLTVNNMRHRE